MSHTVGPTQLLQLCK